MFRCLLTCFIAGLVFFSATVNATGLLPSSQLQDCQENRDVAHALVCAKTILKKNLPEKFAPESVVRGEGYSVYTYRLDSIIWPNGQPAETVVPSNWTHELKFYVPVLKPQQAETNTAVLYIGSGSIKTTSDASPHFLGSHPPSSIVSHMMQAGITLVSLGYEPNQPLSFNGQAGFAEDALVAHTWQYYILHPTNVYYPAHIPMTAAAQQAMDAAQLIYNNKQGPFADRKPINSFLVTGISKRGWTSWLTGLADKRVIGIAPMVIDILNVQKQIAHIYRAYGNHWPIALFFYYVNKITDYYLPSNPRHHQFAQLMSIADPYSYLREDRKAPLPAGINTNFKKYVINASGDDFFPPDSSQNYISSLKDKDVSLLYVPNSGHSIQHADYFDQVNASLVSFYKLVVNNKTIPKIKWEYNKTNHSFTVRRVAGTGPWEVKTWTAMNPLTRDFRFVCGIHYRTFETKTLSKDTDTYRVTLPKSQEDGWQAFFVAVKFSDYDFVVSTPVFVTPDTAPTRVMPNKGHCIIIDPTAALKQSPGARKKQA